MARSPFSVSSRTLRSGRTIWHARFMDDSGTVIKTQTLPGVRSRAAAMRKALEISQSGIIANNQNPVAIDFLISFWHKDSDYVRGRVLRGRVLSDHYL